MARFGAFHLDLDEGPLELGRLLYHGAVAWILVELLLWRESAFAGDVALASTLLVVGLFCCVAVQFRESSRVAAVLLWLVLKVVFALNQDAYTADEAVELISLAWIFAPPSRRSLARRGARAEGDSGCHAASFALVLVISLALLYLDSVPYKLHSRIWREGSALWLGAALPLHGWGFLAGSPGLAWPTRLATWLTLGFESAFLLALLRPARLLLVPIGLVMHLGSAVLLPLPQFGVALAGALLPLLPWPLRRRKGPSPSTLSSRRWLLAAIAVVMAMALSQVVVHAEPYDRRDPISFLLGIRQRPIYLDWHFVLRGPVMRFELPGPEGSTWIPSFDARGYPQVRDRYWKILGWVARSRPDGLAMVDRYLRAWFARQGLPPRTVELWCRDPSLVVPRIDLALVSELRERPWTRCGSWQPDGRGPVR